MVVAVDVVVVVVVVGGVCCVLCYFSLCQCRIVCRRVDGAAVHTLVEDEAIAPQSSLSAVGGARTSNQRIRTHTSQAVGFKTPAPLTVEPSGSITSEISGWIW